MYVYYDGSTNYGIADIRGIFNEINMNQWYS